MPKQSRYRELLAIERTHCRIMRALTSNVTCDTIEVPDLGSQRLVIRRNFPESTFATVRVVDSEIPDSPIEQALELLAKIVKETDHAEIERYAKDAARCLSV